MKLKDIKHNHSLTDLLKILIFAILMMIPFIDVGTRCLYVICNKNAYQSYSNKIVETTEVANPTSVVNGITYQVKYNTTYLDYNKYSYVYGYSSITLDMESIFGVGNYNEIGILEYADHNIRYYTFLNGVITFSANYTALPEFAFVSDGNVRNYNSSGNNFDLVFNTYKQSNLDNVFDYSVNKLSTSELYTWTQQTTIFTGVQTMTTQLGINNTVIPILLVYWFILTVIYIIIDIILKLFTILTHAIGSKTT